MSRERSVVDTAKIAVARITAAIVKIVWRLSRKADQRTRPISSDLRLSACLRYSLRRIRIVAKAREGMQTMSGCPRRVGAQ